MPGHPRYSAWFQGFRAAIGLLVLAAASAAYAQLDETWTLIVNGQVAQANPDGTFRITNISSPDSFGTSGPGSPPDFVGDDFVRLVGSSTVGEVTRYCYSEPFRLRRGETFLVGELTFTDNPPPLPESILIVPDLVTLTTPGQTVQMHVTATLADASTLDVTPASQWTSYRSSNPAVATVNRDGLVTAVSNGPVLITATNEGTTSTTRLLVALGAELTTVIGLVQMSDGSPLPEANVLLAEFPGGAMTIEDGTFAITGTSASSGPLNVVAQVTTETATYLGFGTSQAPVPGGFTDVGIISVQTVCERFGEGCLDTDGDCIQDFLEPSYGFDPNLQDTDGNGAFDGEEDTDLDGLSTCAEIFLGTSPGGTDSDFDGVSDGRELRLGLNPNDNDSDNDGLSDGEEVDRGTNPLVPDNTPPTVSIVSPAPGSELVEGDNVTVRVIAQDDGRVTYVDLSLNDLYYAYLSPPAFSTGLLVPLDADSLTLEAVAHDTNFNQLSTGPIAYPIIPDPLTTVIGSVVDREGAPAAGAEVFVSYLPGTVITVEADGTFVIPDVPTIQGNVIVQAQRQEEGDVMSHGTSSPFPPVRDGNTDVGQIALDPDSVTELFSESDFDLAATSLVFTPGAVTNTYSVCRTPAEAFPTDPVGGTPITFSDDTFLQIPLTDGAEITYFGVNYTSLFLGSNAYITFNQGDSTYFESLDRHFTAGIPRISAFFDDLHPGAGGAVSYKQLEDRFVATFENVPHYSSGGSNNLQIEVFFNGVITFTYLQMTATGGLVGLSPGLGMPVNFVESDFVTYPLCDSGAKGALAGTAVDANGTPLDGGIASLVGLGISAPIGDDGTFVLEAVPVLEQELTLVVESAADGVAAGKSSGIHIAAGATTDLGTVETAPQPDVGGNALADNDHDGLSNAAEALFSTDPDMRDTDDDTCSDAWEIYLHTDPLAYDARHDPTQHRSLILPTTPKQP